MEASKPRKVFVMIACLYLQAISAGLGLALSVMYAELIQVFDSDRSTASLISSVYTCLIASGGIVVSPLIRRFGPGPMVIIGTLVGSFGFAVSFVANDVPTIIWTVGFMGGMGMCVSYLTSFIAAGWIFHHDPGIAIVTVTIGSSVGQTILPYLTELFIAEYNWNGSLLLLSGIMLQCSLCGCLLYTSRHFYKTDTKAEDIDLVANVKKICDVSLITDIAVLLILFNSFLLTGTGNVESFYFVDILISKGFEREKGSFLVIMIGFANMIGRIFGTILRFKVRVKTVYHWIYLWPLVGVSHILAVTLQDYGGITGACILYGITFGTCTAQNQAILFEVCGLARAPQGIALVNLMYGIGNFFCSFVGGVVKDVVGDYDPMFYMATGSALYISMASAAVAWILRHREKYTEEKEEKKRIINFQYNEMQYGTHSPNS